jgi:hypothetical protein
MMTASDEKELEPRAAAALIQQTMDNTRRSLNVKAPLLYAGWGVAWLFGLGAMWLSVRTQSPYHGPSAGPATILGALITGAVVLTIVTIARATKGLSGQSEIQGRIFGLSWPIGFTALGAVEAALGRQGASDIVMGLVGAAGPLLITSVIYLVGAAVWLEWSMFVMGAWLALVTAVGVWTGPVTVLLVEAAAGGGGFLLMAAYLARRARR